MAKPLSDFEWNLIVATKSSLITPKLAGIVAALVPYYLRDVEKRVLREAEARKLADSRHVGAVGDRLKDVVVMVMRINSFEGNFGMTFIVKMLTGDGNVMTWFSSGPPGMNPGAEYMIATTVKDHSTYQGVKETRVTRTTVYTDEGRKQAEEKAAKKLVREAKKAQKVAAAQQP